eukprot:609915_1
MEDDDNNFDVMKEMELIRSPGGALNHRKTQSLSFADPFDDPFATDVKPTAAADPFATNVKPTATVDPFASNVKPTADADPFGDPPTTAESPSYSDPFASKSTDESPTATCDPPAVMNDPSPRTVTNDPTATMENPPVILNDSPSTMDDSSAITNDPPSITNDQISVVGNLSSTSDVHTDLPGPQHSPSILLKKDDTVSLKSAETSDKMQLTPRESLSQPNKIIEQNIIQQENKVSGEKVRCDLDEMSIASEHSESESPMIVQNSELIILKTKSNELPEDPSTHNNNSESDLDSEPTPKRFSFSKKEKKKRHKLKHGKQKRTRLPMPSPSPPPEKQKFSDVDSGFSKSEKVRPDSASVLSAGMDEEQDEEDLLLAQYAREAEERIRKEEERKRRTAEKLKLLNERTERQKKLKMERMTLRQRRAKRVQGVRVGKGSGGGVAVESLLAKLRKRSQKLTGAAVKLRRPISTKLTETPNESREVTPTSKTPPAQSNGSKADAGKVSHVPTPRERAPGPRLARFSEIVMHGEDDIIEMKAAPVDRMHIAPKPRPKKTTTGPTFSTQRRRMVAELRTKVRASLIAARGGEPDPLEAGKALPAGAGGLAGADGEAFDPDYAPGLSDEDSAPEEEFYDPELQRQNSEQPNQTTPGVSTSEQQPGMADTSGEQEPGTTDVPGEQEPGTTDVSGEQGPGMTDVPGEQEPDTKIPEDQDPDPTPMVSFRMPMEDTQMLFDVSDDEENGEDVENGLPSVTEEQTETAPEITEAPSTISRDEVAEETLEAENHAAAEWQTSLESRDTEVPESTEEDTQKLSDSEEQNTLQEFPESENQATHELTESEDPATLETPESEDQATQEILESEVQHTQEIPEFEDQATHEIPESEDQATQEIPEFEVQATQEIPDFEDQATQELVDQEPVTVNSFLDMDAVLDDEEDAESDVEMSEEARREALAMICPDDEVIEAPNDESQRKKLHRELGEDDEEEYMDLLKRRFIEGDKSMMRKSSALGLDEGGDRVRFKRDGELDEDWMLWKENAKDSENDDSDQDVDVKRRRAMVMSKKKRCAIRMPSFIETDLDSQNILRRIKSSGSRHTLFRSDSQGPTDFGTFMSPPSKSKRASRDSGITRPPLVRKGSFLGGSGGTGSAQRHSLKRADSMSSGVRGGKYCVFRSEKENSREENSKSQTATATATATVAVKTKAKIPSRKRTHSEAGNSDFSLFAALDRGKLTSPLRNRKRLKKFAKQ